RTAIGAARLRAFDRLAELLPAARGLPPVEGLRLLLAGLSDAEGGTHAVLAVAAMPVFVAALARQARAVPPVAPAPALGQAADFLRMLDGRPAAPARVAALDSYLSTVADHGLNASTFTARVVASTQAGVLSAVVAALCALKGPLHGGAPGPVLDMLDAIGEPEAVEPWLAARLSAGERLMGFGHRVYRVRDPRADVLKRALAGLSEAGRVRFAERVEAAAVAALARHRPGRSLQTNVEFYTALLLEAVGLPRELFTPVFAIGRVAGWAAHVVEQERCGRILRPRSRYVGPLAEAAE
ncbi:MAG: citrate synthase, partial [Inquilinus sp.]|nr:citrate synthase [Inquilinus sp.]